jgi:serine/threonine protein kinase
MLSTGSVVAGYRIDGVLGTGGMGAVYLAANPTLPRYDALKVLSAELSGDPDFRARFMREADVAAGLDHPNIVSVYNRGQTETGELWIAMQFVDGTNADDALRAGTMTPARAVHIVTEVAEALDYAHAHNVVHRDVKPANFLLSGRAGPAERVLLGDFGIARALDDVGLTVTGSVMATVAYAAPEVLASRAFDGRADLYSLGCTLFRLLTGKTPFSAANGMAAVMLAHLQHPPPRVTDLVPSLPAGLDAVIAVAMAKDPAARFPSARALAEAAATALRDRTSSLTAVWQPVPSREVSSYPRALTDSPWWQPSGPRTALAPPGTGPQHGWPASAPVPPRRRRRARVAAALTAVVVLTAATVAVLAWPRRSPPPAGAGTGRASPPSSTAQGPPATDVPTTALRSILLTAAQISGDTGGEAVVLEDDRSQLFDDSAPTDPAECQGSWAPAQRSVYGGGTLTGVAAQQLRALYKATWQDGIMQAVIAFPSQMDAITTLQAQHRQWDICASRTVTVTPAEQPAQQWTFGHAATVSGVVTLDATLQSGAGSCQHGMMARGNVMIDIRQCRTQGANNVPALVNSTADKVPRQ